MPSHCLFCPLPVVYSNGLESTFVPGLRVELGLCEEHAYAEYRKKSGELLKYPKFNYALMSEVWHWAGEALLRLALKETETCSPCIHYNLLDLLERGMEIFESDPICLN